MPYLFQGTPEIREHYLDSKKDVDRHLKSACEQFIQQQTRLFVEQLEEFMTKVQTVLVLSSLSYGNSGRRVSPVLTVSFRKTITKAGLQLCL